MPGSADVARPSLCSLGGSGGTAAEGMLTLPDTAVCARAETQGLMIGWVLGVDPQAAGLLRGSPNVPISGFSVASRWQRSH